MEIYFLPIALTNSLDQDEDWQNVGPDLDLNRFSHSLFLKTFYFETLEDLKVLRRSSDLFNKVKKRSRSFTAYETYFVLPYMGVAAIFVKWPNQFNEYYISGFCEKDV